MISGKIGSVSKEQAKKMGLTEWSPRIISVIKTDFKMIKK